jgi:hypothetical protein
MPFVIRHGIDDLTREQAAFGGREDWHLDVPEAQTEELELMLRMERALRVSKDNGSQSTKATNDARFHVGWRHLDAVRETLAGETSQLADPAKAVVENQLKSIKRLRNTVGVHSKMAAVGEAVKLSIDQGHKVLLFCHHHATAQELTAHLESVAPKLTPPRLPAVVVWRAAWDQVLSPLGDDRCETQLRSTFLTWLCADLIRAQTWKWLSGAPVTTAKLVKTLKYTNARHSAGGETVAEAAQRLYATRSRRPLSSGSEINAGRKTACGGVVVRGGPRARGDRRSGDRRRVGAVGDPVGSAAAAGHGVGGIIDDSLECAPFHWPPASGHSFTMPLFTPMHAKLVSVDGTDAFTIGSPFLQEYFDTSSHNIDNPERGPMSGPPVSGSLQHSITVPIHDVSSHVKGPAVADMDDVFVLHYRSSRTSAMWQLRTVQRSMRRTLYYRSLIPDSGS